MHFQRSSGDKNTLDTGQKIKNTLVVCVVLVQGLVSL